MSHLAAVAGETPAEEVVWALLLALSRSTLRASPECPVAASWRSGIQIEPVAADQKWEVPWLSLVSTGEGTLRASQPLEARAAELVDRYGPLCHPGQGQLVVAHLGQSLDGRIGPPSGAREAITGPLDHEHNHRLRALFDVVLVGAGTVFHDDPQLNVRLCSGPDPVRAVLDPARRLGSNFRVFREDVPPSLLLVDSAMSCPASDSPKHGLAAVVPVSGGCGPREVVTELAERGLRRIFIEGGGVTVSRFLAAGCLDRLQVTVAPLILGSGRPGLELGDVVRLRPRHRTLRLGEDVLFDCELS